MLYSAENTAIWNVVVQLGIISVAILVSTFLRRKIPFVRKSLLPTAVLAGFLLLILRNIGILKMDSDILETLTYHGIAIGFVALSLRVPKEYDNRAERLVSLKSGALIVSTYLLQGLVGLVVTILLSLTFMPEMFPSAGILLAMGYGQGPGQANNVGSTYEALGFAGGKNFGLALAAAGYLCACIVGVIYLNILNRKGKIKRGDYAEISGSVTVDAFQDTGEIPISESIDRFSMQVALVAMVYFVTYLLTWGVTSLLDAVAPGISKTISPLLWGFNFIIASAIAILTRKIMTSLRKNKIMTRQYQNNYLLSRFSGLAFDVMIVAGIAQIDIAKLGDLFVPFIIMAVLGGIVTFFHLKFLCKKLYGDYYYEGFMSMFGMQTGTISSGILLLREIDPEFTTPAANNLVTGSTFAILFAAPILLLVGYSPTTSYSVYVTFGLIALYFFLLLAFVLKLKPKNKALKKHAKDIPAGSGK